MRPSNGTVPLLGAAALGVASAVAALNTPARPSDAPERPRMILDAIENGSPIYYFAIGSNLSRSHLEGRSICGKKIHVLTMEPAVVPGFRLAFNMTAFPPLEPGMGSLEPLNDGDGDGGKHSALLDYERQECHGALIKLSPADYERVHISEGGAMGKNAGYEEIVVTAVPYDEGHPPVQAVAYRAREHVRLRKDPAPSQRYMNILREGAKELGLKACYQKWLEDHPVQVVPSTVIKSLARNNVVFTVITSYMLKMPFVSRVQSFYLYRAYVPPTQTSVVRKIVGGTVTGVVLLPGASIGFLLRMAMEVTGTMSPKMREFINR